MSTDAPPRLQLACCTDTLLREIADKRMRRRDVGMTYRLAMASTEPTDWKAVNTGIMARWSVSGLK